MRTSPAVTAMRAKSLSQVSLIEVMVHNSPWKYFSSGLNMAAIWHCHHENFTHQQDEHKADIQGQHKTKITTCLLDILYTIILHTLRFWRGLDLFVVFSLPFFNIFKKNEGSVGESYRISVKKSNPESKQHCVALQFIRQDLLCFML